MAGMTNFSPDKSTSAVKNTAEVNFVKKQNNIYSTELPMGFGAALMQNSGAMQYFTGLDERRQREILEATHFIESKQEMKNFVANLASFS